MTHRARQGLLGCPFPGAGELSPGRWVHLPRYGRARGQLAPRYKLGALRLGVRGGRVRG